MAPEDRNRLIAGAILLAGGAFLAGWEFCGRLFKRKLEKALNRIEDLRRKIEAIVRLKKKAEAKDG